MAEMIPGDQGQLRVVDLGAPAAGGNVDYTLPIRTRWRLICMFMRFLADGSAADRYINLRFQHGGNDIVYVQSKTKIIAGEGWGISWFPGGYMSPLTGSRNQMLNFPTGLLLNDEMHIMTAVANMQAGDQLSVAYATIEEWIEPLA